MLPRRTDNSPDGTLTRWAYCCYCERSDTIFEGLCDALDAAGKHFRADHFGHLIRAVGRVAGRYGRRLLEIQDPGHGLGPALIEHGVFGILALIAAQPAIWSTDVQRLKKPDAPG